MSRKHLTLRKRSMTSYWNARVSITKVCPRACANILVVRRLYGTLFVYSLMTSLRRRWTISALARWIADHT